MDELTLWDYLTKPLQELMAHEGFSHDALRAASKMMDMKTTEIEQLALTWRNQ